VVRGKTAQAIWFASLQGHRAVGNPDAFPIKIHRTGRGAAGEGFGHTVRVYVPEESHCGIVPMNHSNQDGTSLAESEEGRLRIKENTLPFDRYPTQRGTARDPRVGGVCGQAVRLAVTHPR
jgi:hypothetical protein